MSIQTHRVKLRLVACLAATLCLGDAKAARLVPVAADPAAVELAVGAASDGTNFLVALTSGTEVAAQVISPDGDLLGPPVGFARNLPIPPGFAVGFGGTNYLAAWSDSSINTGVDIFGQFLSPGGVRLGAPFPLLQSAGTHGFQVVKCLRFDGVNFLVLWIDANGTSLYGQFVSQTGSLVGTEILVTGDKAAPEAALAFDGGRYLAVAQMAIFPPAYDTWGRFIGTDGSLSPPFQISGASSSSHNPLAVAFDGTNYLVVWNRDAGTGSPARPLWRLDARLVTTDGGLVGSQFLVGNQQPSIPSLAFDGDNYLLGWSRDFDTTNSGMPCRFISRSGVLRPVFRLFNPQGTNVPLFGGVVFNGTSFATVATLGTIGVNESGGMTNIFSGDVCAAIIPRSTAPPWLSILPPSPGGQISALLAGTPGINYIIQSDTELSPPAWVDLATNAPVDLTGTFTFTNLPATNSRQFYRAKAGP